MGTPYHPRPPSILHTPHPLYHTMASSQAPGVNSTATNHQNPFLASQNESSTFVSHVPLSGSTAGAGSVDTSSLPSQSQTGLSSSSSTTTAQGISNDVAAQASQVAGQAQASVSQFVNKVTSQETKPNLAGNLAPDEKQIAPEEVPAGTEHVSNLLTSIG